MTTQEFKIGQNIIANKMASDSFYKKVIGTVTSVRNGFVQIDATIVMSKWENEFKKHPTSCATSAKIEDCLEIN